MRNLYILLQLVVGIAVSFDATSQSRPLPATKSAPQQANKYSSPKSSQRFYTKKPVGVSAIQFDHAYSRSKMYYIKYMTIEQLKSENANVSAKNISVVSDYISDLSSKGIINKSVEDSTLDAEDLELHAMPFIEAICSVVASKEDEWSYKELAERMDAHRPVLISSIPSGADIIIDSRKKPQQTIHRGYLEIGDHDIQLSLKGYSPVNKTVTILDKELNLIEIFFEQMVEKSSAPARNFKLPNQAKTIK